MTEQATAPRTRSTQGRTASTAHGPRSLESDRYEAWAEIDTNAAIALELADRRRGTEIRPRFGLVLEEDDPPPTVFRSQPPATGCGRSALGTHRARRGPRGATDTDLVVEITQRRRGYFDRGRAEEHGRAPATRDSADDGDFRYRAGCTLIINPSTMEVRRVIRTPGTIADDKELDRMRRFLTEGGLEPATPLTAPASRSRRASPLRFCTAMGRAETWPRTDEPRRRPRQLERLRRAPAPARRGHCAHVPHRPWRLLPARLRGRCARQAGLCADRLRLQARLVEEFTSRRERKRSVQRQDITQNIRDATGGHIDVAVITHEHQDHVNGISAQISPAFPSAKPGSPGPRIRRMTSPMRCA